MSRKGNEARSVSLFPFLAVLICAMGALIFLLVVTTRRIRHQAILQVQQVVIEETEEDDLYPPILFAAEEAEPEPAPPVVVIPEPVKQEPEPEPEPQIINLAADKEARLKALQLQKAKKLAALKDQNLTLIRLKNELSQSESQLNETQRQYQSLQVKDKELDQNLEKLKDQKLRVAEMLQEELNSLAKKKQSQKSARSKYSIVPYDGKTGTAKRPILIECTDEGLTFQPEGITLTPDDLQDFTPGHNPLLSGTQALFRYWSNKDRNSGQEPYVLILVRPSGSVGYYVARKLLGNLDLDSGYELIDADWELALPQKDPVAKEVCQDAIDRILSGRKQLVSQLNQRQSGSPQGRRLQFDARTGMVRVIEPEGGLGTGQGSEKQITGGTGSGDGKSHFSDVLTPGQRMARAEYLRRVANQKHIVYREGFDEGASEAGERGTGSETDRITGGAKPSGTRGLPGSLEGAEVYDLADLKRGTGSGPGEEGGLKRAKVMGPDQLREMAEQHLVELKNARGQRMSGNPLQAGESETGSKTAGQRVIENPFVKEGNPNGTGTSRQQGTRSAEAASSSYAAASSQSSSASSNPFQSAASGSSPAGAGNASSVSLSRSRSGQAESQSTMNRRWGPPQSRSGIGFEREIGVQIGADRIIVGDEKQIQLDPGMSSQRLQATLFAVMDQYVESWGPAPQGFYWVPSLQFTVSPGGNQYYERLKASAQKMGLETEAQYTLEPLPAGPAVSTGKEQ
ncbi:hypothetical protein [Gimesia panareensis]|uniref:IncA protein n=1 Tax=Gimesia panareensis TaxID=2527978 RepID=A0A517Q2M6_9PLAN|nr:hypothetical protein [Gimesia panareensis]QDT25877.1 hypothetical protein Enr10x_11750 [Gimesia panareensis]QDU48814.1 hypothetical protein Pan110_11300 [Gimesia panareensis]QDV18018.1 hypothetical protein Pan153_26740 [Gimesia panareensis]